ncbi:MAG: OmpA family protein, partial [Flavobacteriales bacterium]|nr:OmpA family protein [Flavobacteriales bacterium]
DSTGGYQLNMNLSKDRAMAVTNYLTGKGISAGRFTTEWFGPDQPTHDNGTAEGRAKNRRVNVAIVPNQKMIDDAKIEAGEN